MSSQAGTWFIPRALGLPVPWGLCYVPLLDDPLCGPSRMCSSTLVATHWGPGCSKPTTSLFPGGRGSLATVTYLGRGVDSGHIVPVLEGGPEGSYQRGQGKQGRQPLWGGRGWCHSSGQEAEGSPTYFNVL